LKFSYQWIRDLVPGLSTGPADLQRLITMKTAECEGIDAVGGHFANVIAVRVLDVQPLPKGKNKAVTIDAGHGRQFVVVCGAPNVRPGLIAPWMPPGTPLGEKTIGRAVIEGVESEGMLASAAELGINRDHAGLLELQNIEPGNALPRIAPDWIIEIDNKSLTHRPDLWGHVGMAREVAAISGRSLCDPVKPQLLPRGEPAIRTQIEDYTLCPRYSALVLENVKVAPSPLWLQARLESVGLNPINNIVDVTNYVLADLPQPMHAFDLDKLHGDTIFVRNAHDGESIRALDGENHTLNSADLVIADANGPIAMAGVIGGADSAISEATTRVVLESANFQSSSVRFTSVRHRLRTDASIRFEKSLDPENALRGLARAVELLQEICPEIIVKGGPADNAGPRREDKPIALPVNFVVRKLGKVLTTQEVADILLALGFGVSVTTPELLTVTVPTWRATKDIALKDDLVEEIGRMIGYGEIVPTPPLVASTVPFSDPMRTYLRGVRTQLAAQWFTEVYNYSFVNEEDVKRFGFDVRSYIAIRNPIASEQTHLRRSLLPGVFKNIINNVRHYPEFRLFEVGREVHPDGSGELPTEATHTVAALYNNEGDEQDFFELKRVVECVFPSCRLVSAQAFSYEHPARSARILWHGREIGRFFELHPLLLRNEGIEGRAVLFDVDLDIAQELSAAIPVEFKPLRKYPTSGFDLSVVTGLKTPVEQVQENLTELAGPDLVMIDFVRQYAGPPLPEGKKSVSYHLEVGAPDHTMTADEVTTIYNRVVQGLHKLGFDLRV
jgi:phenylalanyl-tRNA synthetase beta chain